MHRLSLICILEPFISTNRLEATRVCLGMDHALSMKLLEDIDQMIYCWVSHSLLPKPVFISYVYANCFTCVRGFVESPYGFC